MSRTLAINGVPFLAADEQTELLREMRDLLRVMAEPSLAKRDERLREALTEIVGKSKAKVKAVVLMDGSRTQRMIREQSGIDQGDLSRLVAALRAKALLVNDDRQPKLAISIPSNFFEVSGKTNG